MIYYIDNPSKVHADFLPKGIECMSPADFLAKERNETDELVVLCEIDVDSENDFVNRTDLYGIQFVQQLRLNNYRNKIIFVSFLPLNYILSNAKNYITKTEGHNFIRLPFKFDTVVDEFVRVEQLTPQDLMLCKKNYCDINGIISEITHSITSSSNSTEIKAKVIDCIKMLGNYFELNVNVELANLQSKFPDFSTIRFEEAIAYLKELGRVGQYSNASAASNRNENSEIIYDVIPKASYSVLWLDDEASEDSLLHVELVRIFGENKVHICKSVDEAVAMVKNDCNRGNLRPEIMVAIVDYRLYQNHADTTSGGDPIKVHQQKQGYRFVEEINRLQSIVEIVVHSSIARNDQIWLSEQYNRNVETRPKMGVNYNDSGALKSFLEEVVVLGNKNYNRLNNLPTLTSWKNNLLQVYKMIVKHPRYEEYEKQISEEADNWIKNFKENRMLKPLSLSGNGTFTMVSSDRDRVYKMKNILPFIKEGFSNFSIHPDDFVVNISERDVKLIQDSHEVIDMMFDLLIKSVESYNGSDISSINVNETIKKSIDYFVARRVAAWLTVFLNIKSPAIIGRILQQRFDLSYEAAKRYPTAAGISVAGYHKNLTYEERKWCSNNQYELFVGKDKLNIISDFGKEKEIVKNFLDTAEDILNIYFVEKEIYLCSIIEYNKSDYKVIVENGRIRIPSIEDLKAIFFHLSNRFVPILPKDNNFAESVKLYKSKLGDFVYALKSILLLVENYSIESIETFNYFAKNLCNKFEKSSPEDKKKLLEEYVGCQPIVSLYKHKLNKKYTTLLEEERNLNRPWQLLKRKGRWYTEEDIDEIKKNCYNVCKEEIHESLLRFIEINDHKYYLKEYQYIKNSYLDLKKKREYRDLEEDDRINFAIVMGKLMWKSDLDILNDLTKKYSSNGKEKSLSSFSTEAEKIISDQVANTDFKAYGESDNLTLQQILKDDPDDILRNDKIYVPFMDEDHSIDR